MSRLSLNDVEWKEFFIGGKEGIFNISSTKSGIDKNKLNLEEGNTPYITRSEIDNGINLFISDNQDDKYKKNSGNVITIGLDTQTVFYQNKSFFTGQNIQVLSNCNLNKEISMFIIPLIKIQMEKFNWGGNGATLSRLNRTKIMLPIDSKGNPNWQFMEDYVKQEMKEQSQKIVRYYENKLLKLGFELLDLEVEWKEYRVKDIFNVISVKGKTIKNYDIGETPYITTSSLNNGLSNFIKTIDDISKSNCISIDPIGGKAFYHSYNFVGRGGAGSAINLLYNNNLDEYVGLFISKIIENSSKAKASYGIQLNGNRLKNLKLLLPIDKNGKPNWEYMRLFMQKLEKENISKVLEYIYIYRLASILKDEYSINNIQWNEYFIEDICEIKSGKDIYERERIYGNTPYITATSINNGIGYFINNSNLTLEKGCISVNRNGSVGYSFYHPYNALFGNDTRKLVLKEKNEYIGKFISFMISEQKSKYGYGYKMGTGRLKRQKILLPSTEDGSIDFEFMKKYMIIKEIEEIKKILNSVSE